MCYFLWNNWLFEDCIFDCELNSKDETWNINTTANYNSQITFKITENQKNERQYEDKLTKKYQITLS